MFEKARKQLNEEKARSLRGVLARFKGVFAKHDIDLRNFSAVKHKIDVGGAKPVHYRPRKTPLAFRTLRKTFRCKYPFSGVQGHQSGLLQQSW